MVSTPQSITKEAALQRAALTVNELSVLMGISKITIYRKIESGEIPSLSVGRRRLIPHSYYSQFITGVEK